MDSTSNQNPYQSPRQANRPAAFGRLHPPSRGICPVCRGKVSHLRLFLYSRVPCPQCATILTAAIPRHAKLGLGDALALMACALIVVTSVTLSIRVDFLLLIGLTLLVPVAAIYGLLGRWFHAVPYPASLVSFGRIQDTNDDDLTDDV